MGSKGDFISKCVNVYRVLAENPVLSSAEIVNRSSGSEYIKIVSKWTQRNLELGEQSKFQKHHVFQASSPDPLYESAPVDISNEKLFQTSESEKYHCVVKEIKQENDKKQFIEIWNQNGLFRNFDVSSFDVHGEIYSDGEFGSLKWNPSEDKIIYVAEKKPDKTEAFYPQKPKTASSKDDENGKKVGDQYLYKPDWGEQLVNKHQPVVGICDLKLETLKVLEGIPSNFSPGQLLWSKDGKGIYGTVVEQEPRRLGLIYCTNRVSYIFYLSLNGEFKILSDKNKAVRSPRLSLDGKNLFWLQRSVAGAHGGCMELVKLNLSSNKKEVLIDVVRIGNQKFSGLYMNSLPARCFSKDGMKLFFSTVNQLKIMSYYLDLGSKEIHLLETGEGSSTILDVHDDIILISSASIQRPPCLKMSKSTTKVDWITVTKSEIICKDSVVKELHFDTKNNNEKFTYYNAIYYGPKPPAAEQAVPLIVLPHGGPHSAYTNNYSLDFNFFVTLGYGILAVNYRGSTGVGQDGIDFLLGKIGDTDVKDNHNTVVDLLKTIPYLDSKNIFLYGQSHGGFLVGHLSAQFPDFYRAVVSRNAVTDVYAMYIMSDIPDWASAECGLLFNESNPLTLEQANKMITSSPDHLGNKIKAPTLFLIGKKDLRVPHYGGISLYYALKSRNVKTRLNVYEDNHSLGRVPVDIDAIINSAIWFMENKA